jgi:hypothetical protein
MGCILVPVCYTYIPMGKVGRSLTPLNEEQDLAIILMREYRTAERI